MSFPPKRHIVCQLARMGDLAQTIPLLQILSQDAPVHLICDSAILPWARLIPFIHETYSLDTAHLRRACLEPTSRFQESILAIGNLIRDLGVTEKDNFYVLNDHPVSDHLAATLCGDHHANWLTDKLLLIRSYLRVISRYRQHSHLHLSDIWLTHGDSAVGGAPYLNAINNRGMFASIGQGNQFADTIRQHFSRIGVQTIWAFVLGSGGRDRQILPEAFAGWWLAIPRDKRPGMVLVGGCGEERWAARFLHEVDSGEALILELVGKTPPPQL
ncbi:MAG: hypothetical protein ABH878_07075, partial [bacterium]